MAVFAKLSRKRRGGESATESSNDATVPTGTAAASSTTAVEATESPQHDGNDRSTAKKNKKENISSKKARAQKTKKATKVDAAKDRQGELAMSTDLEFNEPAKWVERMALTSTRSLPTDLNADDDPRREEAFIQQALLSVMRGIDLLERADVPWRRPDDYYAEMYKSDVHMNDIRRAMDASKARIEAQAHRRSMKDQKKYGKEVQAEILRQRAKYKRDLQERLNDWKKKRKGNEAIQDVLNNVSNDNENDDGRGSGGRGGGRRKMQPRPRNVRPGGKSSKRPGKNARHRR